MLIFSIRGQVQTDNLATLEPSVGTYIDGLYVARSYGINANLVDVSNVQVLKGPQGTLFGRNTSAGAVLINTNDPKLDELSGEVTGTYGRYNEADGTEVFNLPLVTDRLAVRGAFQINTRNGYITDVNTGAKYDNVHNLTGRVKALWKPAGNVSVLASAEWFSSTSNGPARVLAYGGPNYLYPLAQAGAVPIANATPVPGYAAAVDAGYLAAAGVNPLPNGQNLAYYQNLAATNPNATGSNNAPYDDTRTQTYSLTTSVEESYGTFKLIGGYRRVNAYANVDLDGTPYQILSTQGIQDLHQWSIEGQLTGKILANRLDYAIGATYFTEAGSDASYSETLVPLTPPGYYDGNINNKSFGIYGQGTFHLTDRFSLTAGLRYSHDKKYVMTHNEALAPATYAVTACDLTSATFTPGAAQNVNCPADHGDNFNSLSYVFGADFKITPAVLLYAKASKGYRSGGENLRADGDPSTFAPFRPEINYEEEIGVKSELFDHKVRLNIAAYYNNIIDAQRTQLLAVTSGPLAGALLTSLGNAGKVRDYGMEADLTVRVAQDFTLQATGNFNNSKYLDYTAPAAFGSSVLADHRSDFFEEDPKSSFTVAGNYHHDFGGVTVAGRVDYSWVASYYNTGTQYDPLPTAAGVAYLRSPAAEIAAATTPAAGILGARLGFGFDQDRYNVAVWGKNLTNNRDFVSSFDVPAFGLVSAVRRDPAAYGVTIGAKF